MKKLYIPTSTLNFNNILSSESISPKAFYAIRGFGYSRWQEVEENNQENVVLLYEEPFEFTRPASDVEDHPMLVEITTDKEYPSIANGLYYSDESIYLSPWRTRFIFFTEQDRRVALSISDSSLETKMIGLYHRQLYVETYNKKDFTANATTIPLNKEAVDFDVRVNKMKGLLYGYYIGALLSSTPELTDKANTLQEIQNIFSSILSSESHSPTVLQHEKLNVCFANLRKFDPIARYLQKVAKENFRAEDIIASLSKYGVVFPPTFDGERMINSLLYATDDYNPAYDWLKREKETLRKEEISEQKLLATSSEEIVLADNALSKIVNTHLTNDTEQKLMKAWVNDVLSSSEYSGKITTFAEALSDVVTRKAKEVYADSWDESRAKVELNQMRRYIRAQESSMSWKDDIFSAIAAVLAKGSDWEQLRSFMQSKLMSDYRMVFALYGELNGFANLTRDFTDNLFGLHDNRKYIADVYKEIFGQLHGTDPTYGNITIIESYSPSIVNETPQEDSNKVPEVTSGNNVADLNKRVKEIIASHPRIKISAKEKQAISWAISKAQNDGIAFINMIDNEMDNLTKGIFPHLQKEFHPNYKPIGKREGTSKNKTPKQPSLFSNLTDNISGAIGSLFEKKADDRKERFTFEYSNIEKVISLLSREFGYDKKVLDSIRKDLLWVLDPQYSERMSPRELIAKFREQLLVGKTQRTSSKGRDMLWKNELYHAIDIDAIIESLETCCL